jgi:hypothetical protein
MNRTYRLIRISTFVASVILSNQLIAQTVEVPLTHWSYDFIERLHTRGLIDSPILSTRPLTRLDMAKMIIEVANDPLLDEMERERISFLLFEWREEVEALGNRNDLAIRAAAQAVFNRRRLQWLPDFVYRNARNLFSFRSGDMRAYVDPILYYDWMFNDTDTLSRQDRVYQAASGFSVWGTLGSRIGFFLDARDTREWGTRTYPRGARITWERFGHASGYGTHVYHDETVGYLFLNIPYVEVELGKNNNRWGPGRTGALALSDYATSYDQIKLSAKFWKARFTYVHGFLRQYPPLTDREYMVNGVTRKIFSNKFLAAHRLEVRPWRWLQVGLHETVIYGERNVELAYLNPINFYRSAEHFLGDRDNAMMGMDVELRPRRDVRLYAELLLDDFSVSRIGDDWYGNKTAWLAGAHLTNPLHIARSDFRFEYVRLEPYLYTHTFPINVYKNYGSELGHWAGPNSDVLYGEFLYWLNLRWQFKLQATHYRHGANPADRNIGGDIDRAFVPGDPQTVKFLDGIKEQRTTLGVQASYEFVRSLAARAAVQHTRFLNAPSSAGRTDVDTWSFFFAVGLNY